MTSGFNPSAVRRAIMWSVPPSGADGLKLALHPHLVGRRGRHQSLLSAGVGEDAGPLSCRRSTENRASGGSWLRLARSSRLATSSELRKAMLPEQSMT